MRMGLQALSEEFLLIVTIWETAQTIDLPALDQAEVI